MHYLKCNNCGHLNELKSEYMTFCTKCSKKLENNYSDWKIRNSDQSFDEFKQVMCTTEAIEASKEIPKTKNRKGIKLGIIFTLVFAVAFAIFYSLGQIGGEGLVELFREKVSEKVLMVTASELNKTCPVMIDNATRLDNTIALPGNVFQYNYTLIDMSKDSVNIEELKAYLEPTIINFVKTNPDMQILRDNKVQVNYYYKDKSGVYLFTISVKPEQYE
ncbi:hypothetical protein [Labilibaculum euxinus]|uniref:Uncharacterized protein n=1 Tax=Labilibaculum euxinus TaxID=2686357 RepID=A0A7M4D910_9BACT|nr:hypothetical protein [Labilibaculum euxinus]MUP39139.1 hypothetical protein [Labilibaculum euxinus]MVB08344.1 hypothetical protein [Labilibaculum euxinus]